MISILSMSRAHLSRLAISLQHKDLLTAYLYTHLFSSSLHLKPHLKYPHTLLHSLIKLRKFVFLENKNVFSETLLYYAAREFDRWSSRVLQNTTTKYLIAESTYSLASGRMVQLEGGKYIVDRPCTHSRWQSDLIRNEASKLGITPRLPSEQSIIVDEQSYDIADLIVVPSSVAKASFDYYGLGHKTVISRYSAGINSSFHDKNLLRSIRRRSCNLNYLRILFVGNASIRKGIHILIQACSLLSIPHRITFVGSIQPEAFEIINRYSISNFEFLGRLKGDSLAHAFLSADLLVLPSIEEGYGMVAMEALSFGTIPVVSSAVGSCDQLNHGVNSFIFNSCDPDCLSQTLINYWNLTSQERYEMSKNALFSNLDSSWNAYSDSLLDMLPV